MDGILDFDHEFDVNLFDRVIYALFNGSGAEQAEAQRVLTLFQEHPSAWQRVPYILSTTTNQHAQYLCCNILDKLIQTRWKALSVEHRQDIRSFITTVIIATSESEDKLRRERLYLHKLNLLLVQQPGETEPFIDEILRTIYRITNDLRETQMQTFYEALGYMIASQPNKNTQDALIRQMMESPNQAWTGEMQLARQGINIVVDSEHAKVLSNVLKTNVAVCVSLGSFYWTQLTYIWNDLLAVYRAASSAISEAVATGGPQAVNMQNVRTCRAVKKDVLRLIDTFIRKAEDLDQVNRLLVPQLFEAVLSDYREVLPAARDAEVINVVHTAVSRLGGMVIDCIPAIIESIFEPTLAMISGNETEFPEQRLAVFRLLRAIDAYSFEGLLKLQPGSLYNVLNSIGFAFKHMQRDVAEVGLATCLDAINNFALSSPDISNAFFTSYYLTILGDILQVLTDSDHKGGFKGQCAVLQRLIQLVIANDIHTPLYDPSQIPAKTNDEFIRSQLTTMLNSAFGHMSPIQIDRFVQNLWDYSGDGGRFRLAVRDFLITLKEFAGDNAELFKEDKEMEVQKQREMQMRVPGMVKNESMDDEEL
ncbi:hypothetical protein CALVIDRAFT_555521 [Calocera viscosa TUFC12733]|uniref:Importin N-terminal domain-containing protein n=1 Tax=Calocera viscosa (strain TUFC12733) TaxID=1330018 RepID=A0A167LK04_CALVF|nr:hypothetical protein CALVIDRAFT_555521 [Calocera viscosa TUFC12733]